MAKELSNSDKALVRFAQEFGGHLQVMHRQKGTAYYYRYREGSKTVVKIFKIGSSPIEVKKFIKEKSLRNFTLQHGFRPERNLPGDKMALEKFFEWSRKRTISKYPYPKSRYQAHWAIQKFYDFFKELGGDTNVSLIDLTTKDIRAFTAWLKRQGVNQKSRETVIFSLKRIFRDGARAGKISHFPFFAAGDRKNDID